MRKVKQATIKDVSKLAGVGISTVSRYTNKSGYVSEEISKRIAAAIQELGYIPSNYARILKGSTTKMMNLIVPDITNPYYAEMYSAVQEMAEEQDYYVYLYQSKSIEKNELKAIKESENMSSDALIFCSEKRSERVLEYLKGIGIPTVVSNLYNDVYFDTICSEDGRGIYLMTKYLIEQGHRKIGYAGGSSDSHINIKRKGGYQRALEEHLIELNEEYIFEMDFSVGAGFRAGKYFTTVYDRPTAICAANDLIALGVITGLLEQSIRVPEDISVTGEDNIELGGIWRPSLTTVENSGKEFGQRACRMIFDRLLDGYDGEARVIQTERNIIERKSSRKLLA